MSWCVYRELFSSKLDDLRVMPNLLDRSLTLSRATPQFDFGNTGWLKFSNFTQVSLTRSDAYTPALRV